MWNEPRPRLRSVTVRYALLMGAITASLLLASGLLEMLFSYRDARQQISTLQTLQARAAAAEIEQYMATARTVLRSVSALPWGQPGFELEQRRAELQRLMVLLPAAIDLTVIGRQGQELLFISRTEPDRMGARKAVLKLPLNLSNLAAGEFGVGPTSFQGDAQPLVQLAQADAAPSGALTLLTLNLRFLGDVIARLRVGELGQIYLVDERNHLIAHPRATHVLRKLDLGQHDAIRSARQALSQASAMSAVDTVDIEGRPVTSTAVALAVPGWLLFVEQPSAEVLRPLSSALLRTAGLVAAGLALAVAASLLFARHMAGPIVRLRQATQGMARGDFAARVQQERHDELGQLAQDFNLMAAQLQSSYAGLEARIVERTRELAQARDAAERASAAKTRFLATASHDLRQPMHTIGLLATVLRAELRERRALKVAEKLQACVQLMEALFSSLLDISKLDAGGVRVVPQSFAVNELLERMVQAFEPQAQEKRLTLRVRSCKAMVHTDAALLERVLSNLVANALQYTQHGGVLVGCRRRGQLLALQVWDTGSGISSAQTDAIFEEFYRIDAAGSHRTGLGLGLSIVKRSVELMGHQLRLCSLPGRGSLFEVLLPCAAVEAAAVTQQSTADQLPGAFVLLIDDHEDNRLALEALCLKWGCHVVAVESAAAALSALQGHLRTPDLLLTDFHLGSGPDGLCAVQTLRDSLAEPLPALLITAEQDTGIQARAQALGVQVLHKPVGPQLLHGLANALLAAAARHRRDDGG